MEKRPVHRYFEFAPTDRAMAVLDEDAPFTLHVGVEVDGPLDHERLRGALERLARRHPILTATVDRSADDPRWEPGTVVPELFEVFDETGDRVLSSRSSALTLRPLDAATGPTCALGHVHHANGERSRLVFGVHHAVADARAAIMMLDDLREFYAALERGDDPVVDVDWSPRTLGALLDAGRAALDARVRRVWDVGRRWAMVPRSTHRDASDQVGAAVGPAEAERTIRLDDALVGTVAAAARAHGWRLNPVMLTLLARAWSRVFGREPVEPSVSGWLVTVDCRRQFGVERGAGNLSGLEPVSLVDVETHDLMSAIEQTHRAFVDLGRDGAGLAAEVVAPGVRIPSSMLDQSIRDTFALRTSVLRTSRLYSAAGFPPSLARWGDAVVTELGWMPQDRMAPPYVTVVPVRFGGTTTVALFGAPGAFPAACTAALGSELQDGLEEVAARL
jgi:hypothetical protein